MSSNSGFLIFATNPEALILKAEVELSLEDWRALLEAAPDTYPWDKLKMEFDRAVERINGLVQELS